MFDNNPQASTGALSRVELHPLFRNVYMWMFMGLLTTTAVAVYTSTSGMMLSLLANPPILIGAIIGELALVFILSAAINRLSATVAGVMFFAYSALNGFTLSLIFLAYELGTISIAFGVTAVLFGIMTVFAMTTQIDLTRYRSYFMMALIGLVIAMVVNMFLGSGPLDYVISMVGVLLFTALAAYDTQVIKQMAQDPALMQQDSDTLMKISIIGALKLYLDFINLFLFLLRLFGGRD